MNSPEDFFSEYDNFDDALSVAIKEFDIERFELYQTIREVFNDIKAGLFDAALVGSQAAEQLPGLSVNLQSFHKTIQAILEEAISHQEQTDLISGLIVADTVDRQRVLDEVEDEEVLAINLKPKVEAFVASS